MYRPELWAVSYVFIGRDRGEAAYTGGSNLMAVLDLLELMKNLA